MMTDWYERTIKALPLNGKGERTQECYTRAVRMLSEFYEKTRDLVSEEELQEYFLHKKNVNKWAPNTMRICYEKCGTLLTELNKCNKELRINNYEEGLCQGRPGLMPLGHYIMSLSGE